MLEDLESADDVALLSSTMNHLQYKTTKLEDNSAKVGLKRNAKKCKVLKVNSKREASLNVRNSEVEEVGSFRYLGANFITDSGDRTDIRKRIAMACASFRRLDNIWKVTNISREIKVSLFKSLVPSVLLYGCEMCNLTKTEVKKINSFQTKCLIVLKVSSKQHISNLTVLEMAETASISGDIRIRRWNWIGHILR